LITLARLGKSTSRIGFGTGGLLRIGSARGRQSALAAALASGITHFDTAPIYGLGESERALGRFLQGHRHEITITTKFGLRPSTLAKRLGPLQRAARGALRAVPVLRRVAVRNAGVLYAPPCFSTGSVQHSLEASLRALRTDYVDFYLAHQASPDSMPDEALIDLLEGLRRAGKILAFGIATDFEKVIPVLQRRPQLARVVQFDSDVSMRHPTELSSPSERLLITYGSLRRSIALCRARLTQTALDDERLGGMLLRAAVLANPNGIVLMQSRSLARIARNVRAATEDRDDEQVKALVSLMGASA
jgi:D-threo-aldose 1-dehydrogenase